LGYDGATDGPYDVTKILKEHPEALYNVNDSHWGPLNRAHHWGESLFGYYVADDDFILRKHASMLVNAGVDVIIFDVSYGKIFRDYYHKLCSIYTDIRAKGGRTPQIAFFCPFRYRANLGRNVSRAIYEDLYANGSYSELWFRWKGKPLMLADPENVDDVVLQFFTLRRNIGHYNVGPTGPDQWAWLEIYPQHVYPNSDGEKEEAAVGVAENYNTIQYNSTAPMSWPGAFGRSYHNNFMDNRTDAVNWGLNFAEQWQRALELDPLFVYVTGWNEWTANRLSTWSLRWVAPPVIFVDEFLQEFSRDIEPMSGGHGDNYYYQLVDYVRRYKGVRPLTPVNPSPIVIDGNFDEWTPVQPSFQTDPGTPVWRDYRGCGKAGPYVNHTGRNDIIEAKVSYNGDNVYFYVRTNNFTTNYTDPNWMLLFLNVDANYTTGWLGYDFVINRAVQSSQETSLERNNQDNAYVWTKVADVSYVMRGKELELMIPRRLLDISSSSVVIDFKWADNIQQDGRWSDFTLNGDAAPPDRFNFRAQLN
jgi:hypothetical protein